MSSPTELTNYDKVINCISYNLRTITAENGYRTDGMWVDNDNDPSALLENWPKVWQEKQAAAFIIPGDDTSLPSTGTLLKTRHEYKLYAKRTIKNKERDAGRHLRGLRADMVDDFIRCFRNDYRMRKAAEALTYPVVNVNDGNRVSCINHQWLETLDGGYSTFSIFFVCRFSFEANIVYPISQ